MTDVLHVNTSQAIHFNRMISYLNVFHGMIYIYKILKGTKHFLLSIPES